MSLFGRNKGARTQAQVDAFTCGTYNTETGIRPVTHTSKFGYVIDQHRSVGSDTSISFDSKQPGPATVSAEYCVNFLKDAARRYPLAEGIIFHKKGIIFLMADGTYLIGNLPTGNIINAKGNFTVNSCGDLSFDTNIHSLRD